MIFSFFFLNFEFIYFFIKIDFSEIDDSFKIEKKVLIWWDFSQDFKHRIIKNQWLVVISGCCVQEII